MSNDRTALMVDEAYTLCTRLERKPKKEEEKTENSKRMDNEMNGVVSVNTEVESEFWRKKNKRGEDRKEENKR